MVGGVVESIFELGYLLLGHRVTLHYAVGHGLGHLSHWVIIY